MRVATVLFVSTLLLPLAGRAQEQAVQVTVSLEDRLGPMEIDRMALGQGGLSAEPMWDSRIAEIRALRPSMIRLFIQEYFDLLPEKGRYHFDALDRSVDTILKTGAEPIMCICFKPRVLFPEINQDIVEPSDYDHWEKLIFSLVRHYKEKNTGIRYWEVANEPDIGESGGCPYRFKPESYVRYYKHTVEAILRADPDARVGGPALANVHSPILPALLEFCEEQKVPLHFVSWHIYSSSPQQIRGTINYVKELLKKYPSIKVETILNEWNMDLSNPPTDPRFQPCFVAEVIWQMKEAGLDYSCYYHIRDYHVSFEPFAKFMSPGGTAFMYKWWNRRPQYDGLFDYQNTVRPTYFTFKLLSRLTGERLRLTSSSETVHGLASWDQKLQLYNVLLWNFSPSPATVNIAPRLRGDKLAPAEAGAGSAGSLLARPIVLDAASGSYDENSRLRIEGPVELKRDNTSLDAQFEPYGIRFWSIERQN
jgi:beta-xylosidase